MSVLFFDHLAKELRLESVDEVLYGLVVRVEDQALVTEADQLDVLHLKQEAAGGRPALGCWTKVNTFFGIKRIFVGQRRMFFGKKRIFFWSKENIFNWLKENILW